VEPLNTIVLNRAWSVKVAFKITLVGECLAAD
jgi:hypothetical protein